MRLYKLAIFVISLVIFLVIFIPLTFLVSHTHSSNFITPETVFGFWGGLWHGMTLFLALIISIWNDDILLYAPSNNGGWYIFGFIWGFLGSLSSSTSSIKTTIKKK